LQILVQVAGPGVRYGEGGAVGGHWPCTWLGGEGDWLDWGGLGI